MIGPKKPGRWNGVKWDVEWWFRQTLRYRLWGAAVCAVFGHRRLKSFPHADICETPWDSKHLEATKDVVDATCFYCDSGWLT